MTLVTILLLLLAIAIIGAAAWALITYVPMPQPFRGIIIVVAALFCLVIVLQAFGGLNLVPIDGGVD